jgi:2-octaprenyl-6-methoxyphenol hydroxylase
VKAAAPKAVIIGGGPIGLACAALLAQRRIHSCVLDGKPLEQARRDARLLALSRGTWDMLAPLLGADLPPRAPIREVFVSSAGDFGSTRISAADFGGAELGATVYYGDLLAALAAGVAARGEIEVRRPVTATEVRQRPDGIEVPLADGAVLSGDLVIHAEGLAASPEDPASAAREDWALLADVRLQPARDTLPTGAAFERFTRSGPLALLPMPGSGAGAPLRSFALVWCMDEAQAQRRSQLDDQALLAELQAELGPRIGLAAAIGPRRAVALPRRMRDPVHQHRAVAVGNAAQTLHPVAGQGFNLGIRDCATLADELAQAAAVPEALARYAQRRRADRNSIALLTASLPAVFATRFAPLRLARGLGLALLDAAPPLRRELAQLLMFGVRS